MAAAAEKAGSEGRRSRFVTALAWIFIGLAGFSTVIAVLQNIMLALMFPVEEMRAAVRQSEHAPQMPGFVLFLFENIRLFFAAFLAVSLGALVSAIGLLLRRNWARLLFIAIMALGVAWNLAGLAMPLFMASLVADMPQGPDPDLQGNFRLMWHIMTGFMVVIGLAVTALFVWIIRRLVSAEVRQEFGAG